MSKCVNANKSRHTYVHNIHQLLTPDIRCIAGFPTGVENIGGEGGGGLKMLSKNTCEGVHSIEHLPARNLQACKFTKNELLRTYFSRILARF